jgi:signal transduction histidine kinase
VISIQDNDDHIAVTIHNNGKSIKAQDAEAIFDKFYQSRNQKTSKPIKWIRTRYL